MAKLVNPTSGLTLALVWMYNAAYTIGQLINDDATHTAPGTVGRFGSVRAKMQEQTVEVGLWCVRMMGDSDRGWGRVRMAGSSAQEAQTGRTSPATTRRWRECAWTGMSRFTCLWEGGGADGAAGPRDAGAQTKGGHLSNTSSACKEPQTVESCDEQETVEQVKEELCGMRMTGNRSPKTLVSAGVH
ncbi:hypothetical protein B0H17DRAFT_1139562 [Mycena rosella]|uniref:Uncharacterized protein n=1 Tax=Mycena rosella TaxID=1033263 RepID=A0AAD7D3V7_MYCRO|nr:hypothetical protein B0H17DRAFT_1139562 [Mycena rosella]